MPRHFLAIGEAMVEISPNGDGLFALGFAGDTLNTAWYLRRLAGSDWDIGYMTGIGDDDMSAQMAAFMRDAGLSTHLVKVPGRTVGLYMISLNNGERSFSYWRSVSAAKRLADDLTALEKLGRGDVAYYSGITIAILENDGREKFVDAIAAARARGVTTVFDPNLRPRLWDNNSTMCDAIMTAAKPAGIVMPSHEDEATFFGDADKPETATRYLEQGADLVIVKDGPHPVLAVSADGSTTQVAPQIIENPVDTTAAGDSFNAGFLALYMDGKPLEDAIRNGCRLSAKVVSQRGALVADIA